MKQLLTQLFALVDAWSAENETLKAENAALKKQIEDDTDADLLARIQELEAEKAEAIASIENFLTANT